MEKLREPIVFASVGVEISEHKTHLKVTNRLCYYDAPNGNNVLLPYDEKTEELAQTIVNMPVKAKYRPNKKGEPDLGDHEVVKRNGEIEFRTVPVGTHKKVYIKEEEVSTFGGETKKLHVLYAEQVIWKENKNVVSAVKRLFDAGKLHSSWELQGYEYSYKEGIKTITDYAFLANVYLGENVTPAYGNMASVTDISAVEPSCETIISEALALDMAEKDVQDGEVEKMEDEVIVSEVEGEQEISEEAPAVEQSEEVEEVDSQEIEREDEPEKAEAESEEKEEGHEESENEEVSALTAHDISDKINRALWGKEFYLFMYFPEEKTIWARRYGEEETKIYVFTYAIEDNEVVLSEPVEKELVVSALKADEEILNLRNEVSELKSKNDEYSQYKEAYEKSELEKAEAEHRSKVEALKKKVEETKCFSAQEIANFETAGLFEELKENELNAKIVDRMIEKSSHEHETDKNYKEKSVTKSVIETSEVTMDSVKMMRSFLFGKN